MRPQGAEAAPLTAEEQAALLTAIMESVPATRGYIFLIQRDSGNLVPYVRRPDEPGADDGEIVVKFSHVTNTDKHPKGIAASLLEKRVNEEMNGKACMQVFPNSTLYDDKKVLEAMLNGDVQMAAPSLSKFEKFTKKFRIFDLPFVFEDVDAVDRFQNSADGERLLNSMNRRGLKGLAFWHNGMKQMSANRPLIKPEDAAGLKFRVQPSDVLVAQNEVIFAAVFETDDRAAVDKGYVELLLRKMSIPFFGRILGGDPQPLRFNLPDGHVDVAARLVEGVVRRAVHAEGEDPRIVLEDLRRAVALRGRTGHGWPAMK